MTSQIDPNNINVQYPVPGQDNSTQGFRTNFTGIRSNFTSARNEITDLQNKVLLKQNLGPGTAPAQNLLDGAILDSGRIRNFSLNVNNIGLVSGAQEINYAAGHYQIIGIDNGSVSLTFTGFPSTSRQAWIILQIDANQGDTLTLPSAVTVESLQGIQGINGQTITFAAAGKYEFEFRTTDNGSTIYVTDLTRPKNLWTNPLFVTGSETVANLANISLTTATSFFNVANTDQTANLAAGANGQVKVLALAAKGTGNVTVTVSGAGWKASGTGTAQLTALGSAVTLQYFNSKWYCIGNNGATFA